MFQSTAAFIREVLIYATEDDPITLSRLRTICKTNGVGVWEFRGSMLDLLEDGHLLAVWDNVKQGKGFIWILPSQSTTPPHLAPVPRSEFVSRL